MSLQNFQLIEVKRIGWTDTKPTRIKMKDLRFTDKSHSVTISRNELEDAFKAEGKVELAALWLKDKGYNVVGVSANHVIIAATENNFYPLTEKGLKSLQLS